MYKALIAIVFAAALAFAPMKGSEAATAAPAVICNGPSTSESVVSSSPYYLLQIGGGQQYITGVCVQTSAGTISITAAGHSDLYGACYFVQKSQKVAVVAAGSGYNTSCPTITKVSVRYVRGNG